MHNTKHFLLVFLCLFQMAMLPPRTAAQQPSPHASPKLIQSSDLGMNLAPISFWSTSVPFNNVLLAAKWEPQNNGVLKGSVFVSTNGRYPGGMYLCTYEGRGVIRFSKDATAVEYGKGFIKVAVRPRNYLEVQLRSDPNDPIRNLKLLLPGTADLDTPFNPIYLQRLRPFKVIRFMDWQRTNNNKIVTWDDRPTLQNEITDGQGVALPRMVDLANELEIDPWFCMPHMADDNFIKQFATYVRDNLNPNSKIYIEYSNEVWNGAFAQHRYIMAAAKEKAAATGDEKYNWLDEWAAQISRTFNIWQEVFEEQPHRLIRVVASQEVNPWLSSNLTRRVGKGNFDALATTAYFGNRPGRGKVLQIPNFQARPLAIQLVAGALNQLNEQRAPARIKQGEIAREYEIPYITYEAGQHIVPGSDTARQAVDLAQQLPEMYQAYLQNIQTFKDAGGSLYMAFNFVQPSTNFGSWGHLQYQNQPLNDAPKFRAILDAYNVRYPDPPNLEPTYP